MISYLVNSRSRIKAKFDTLIWLSAYNSKNSQKLWQKAILSLHDKHAFIFWLHMYISSAYSITICTFPSSTRGQTADKKWPKYSPTTPSARARSYMMMIPLSHSHAGHTSQLIISCHSLSPTIALASAGLITFFCRPRKKTPRRIFRSGEEEERKSSRRRRHWDDAKKMFGL